MNMDYNNS